MVPSHIAEKLAFISTYRPAFEDMGGEIELFSALFLRGKQISLPKLEDLLRGVLLRAHKKSAVWGFRLDQLGHVTWQSRTGSYSRISIYADFTYMAAALRWSPINE